MLERPARDAPRPASRLSFLGGAWEILVGLPVFALLYVLSLHGPAVPHYFDEIFGIVVAAATFMLTWNARRFIDNHYFLFLGISLLFVGVIDFLHAIAFDGLVDGRALDVHAQLCYSARILQGVCFVAATRFVDRKVRPGVVFAGFCVLSAVLLGAIYGRVLPAWYGRPGPVGFRAGGDLVLLGLGAAGILALRRVREHFSDDVFHQLVLAIVFAMSAGVPDGLENGGGEGFLLLGDVLEAMSYYLVYKAVIETGLLRQYDLLFRNLKRREEEARAAKDELGLRVVERTAQLREVNARLEGELRARRVTEEERETTIDLLRLTNAAKNHLELAESITSFLHGRLECQVVGMRFGSGKEYPYLAIRGMAKDLGCATGALCLAASRGEDAGAPSFSYLDCLCGAVLTGGKLPSPPFCRDGGTWRANRAAEFPEESADPRLRRLRASPCLAAGIDSMAFVPLRIGEETVGLLHFADARKDRFTPELLRKYERIAGHVAVAVARLLSKEALRESEDRFRTLLENAPVGILIVQDGRLVFKNPSLDRLFDKVPDGIRFEELGRVHPEDTEKFHWLCQVLERGDPGWRNLDLRFLLPGEEEGQTEIRWVYCQSGSVEYGGRRAALVVLDDMTRLKDLEQIVSTREKLANIGQMAASIAHEIRNPLSGININVSTLEHMVRNLPEVSSEERERIGAVVAQAKSASEKIATVVRRVMDFAKPSPPKLERVDANRIVREALEFMSTAFRKSGTEIETSLPDDLPRCIADSRLLEQVLLNLLSNAMHALENVEGRRRIGVGTVVVDRRIVVQVSDNGPGIPAHLREKIFDPFYTTRRDGHGIGLSFSHRAVESQGGKLSAGESEWGGARFRIELPAASEWSPA